MARPQMVIPLVKLPWPDPKWWLPSEVTMANGFRILGGNEHDGSWYMPVDVLWKGSALCVPIIEVLWVSKLTQAWELGREGVFSLAWQSSQASSTDLGWLPLIPSQWIIQNQKCLSLGDYGLWGSFDPTKIKNPILKPVPSTSISLW